MTRHLNQAQRPGHRIVTILAVSALALGLSACGRTEDTSVGQRMDSTGERAAPPAVSQSTVDQPDRATEGAQAPGTDAGQSAANTVDDAAITAKVNASLASDPDLSAIRINVDTVNGTVTLNGPAPTAAARERAEMLAKAVDGVTAVNNKLSVSAS